MDLDIELAVANDVQISGTHLYVMKNRDCFELSYENVTQVIQLGKTAVISDNENVRYKHAYALRNEMHEIGKFNDKTMYENHLKLSKPNILKFESIQYFKHKKLVIQNIYLKK